MWIMSIAGDASSLPESGFVLVWIRKSLLTVSEEGKKKGFLNQRITYIEYFSKAFDDYLGISSKAVANGEEDRAMSTRTFKI